MIKVLTIKQPWAALIMSGGKDIENRDWYTGLRGRIAIHSSMKLDWQEWMDAEAHLADLRERGLTDQKLPNASMVRSRAGFKFTETPNGIHCGAILGTVELVDCVRRSDSPWFFGKYGFVLKNPVVFEKPVVIRGAQGFWDWDERQVAA